MRNHTPIYTKHSLKAIHFVTAHSRPILPLLPNPWRPIRTPEREFKMILLPFFDCSPRRHGIRKRTVSCFVSKINRAPVPEEAVTVIDTNDQWHPRIWLR
ncbi:hypothetical protein CDAR_292271 [Caerostris darwini]|uniref:Uncharacterized protein n=1 Tax=Caerostris darwini TaxID=1538125 RepID=A0AAV4UCT4_9ARAC|nr:hypothetical protein CDAR_292271 [Caerostris darwini]